MEIDAIKQAMTEVMKKELGDLYVDREQHFLDHDFLRGMRKNVENTRSFIFKSIVGGMVLATLAYVGQAAIHVFIEYIVNIIRR